MGVELRHLHGGNFRMGKASRFGRIRFRAVRFNCGGGLGSVWRLRRCRQATPAPAAAGQALRGGRLASTPTAVGGSPPRDRREGQGGRFYAGMTGRRGPGIGCPR